MSIFREFPGEFVKAFQSYAMTILIFPLIWTEFCMKNLQPASFKVEQRTCSSAMRENVYAHANAMTHWLEPRWTSRYVISTLELSSTAIDNMDRLLLVTIYETSYDWINCFTSTPSVSVNSHCISKCDNVFLSSLEIDLNVCQTEIRWDWAFQIFK